MPDLYLILAPVPLDKLKSEQPKLHRELCEGIAKLYRAKNAIKRLPQPYVIDGALAEVLQHIEDAMAEVGASWTTHR